MNKKKTTTTKDAKKKARIFVLDEKEHALGSATVPTKLGDHDEIVHSHDVFHGEAKKPKKLKK